METLLFSLSTKPLSRTDDIVKAKPDLIEWFNAKVTWLLQQPEQRLDGIYELVGVIKEEMRVLVVGKPAWRGIIVDSAIETPSSKHHDFIVLLQKWIGLDFYYHRGDDTLSRVAASSTAELALDLTPNGTTQVPHLIMLRPWVEKITAVLDVLTEAANGKLDGEQTYTTLNNLLCALPIPYDKVNIVVLPIEAHCDVVEDVFANLDCFLKYSHGNAIIEPEHVKRYKLFAQTMDTVQKSVEAPALEPWIPDEVVSKPATVSLRYPLTMTTSRFGLLQLTCDIFPEFSYSESNECWDVTKAIEILKHVIHDLYICQRLPVPLPEGGECKLWVSVGEEFTAFIHTHNRLLKG